MKFQKVLAKYYHKWMRDCFDSVIWCNEHGYYRKADEYFQEARKYFDLIINHWDEIEFFSVDDNAFKSDKYLPPQFRGWE